MPNQTVVVTGIAQHSLGEALLRHFLQNTSFRLIGIDRIRNHHLPENERFRQVQLDLNPLNHKTGIQHFAATLQAALAAAVTDVSAARVDGLVQCAAVYGFGTLSEHDVQCRAAILGLNILGTTEVLYGTMKLNESVSRQTPTPLTHILIGSYQGLSPRAGRPLYGPSKAYGIDLCSSLFDGREISRCFYIAPGPIDTPMLHRNHWVLKSGGSDTLFQKLLNGNAETYRKIFIQCSELALKTAARAKKVDHEELHRTMAKYLKVRRKVASEPPGILSADACATGIARILSGTGFPSGLYSLGANRTGGVAARMAPFGKLDRSRTFDSVAIPVSVDS